MTPRPGRIAALLVAAALAGCTFLVPPDDGSPDEDGEQPAPPLMEGSGPSCGRVTLAVEPPIARAGETIAVRATLANCGNVTLTLDRGLCPDEGAGFHLLVARGLNDFHLHARSVAEAAAIDDAPCAPGASVFGLPPSRDDVAIVHTVTFLWNATFAVDPCYPSPSSRETACLQYAAALPGIYLLRARIVASNATHSATAAVVVEGEAPSDPSACGRADLVATLESFDVRVENCGASDLTLSDACREPYPVRIEIRRADTTWRLAEGTASRAPVCVTHHPTRIVPAGGVATARLAWDGRFDGAPAQPGEYQVVARLTAREGWSAEAVAVLTIGPGPTTRPIRARARRAGGARAGARAAWAAGARRPMRA